MNQNRYLIPFHENPGDLDVVLDTIGGQTQALSWQTLKKPGYSFLQIC